MALFSKPPAKKPEPAKPSGARPHGPRALSAREIAAQAGARPGGGRRPVEPNTGDNTVTGAGTIEWTPARSSIEVAQANPGLCAVLENAALLYAGGQERPARDVLEQGVQSDPDAKLSPLAWLALFDLLQRLGDRAAFDQLALSYVVQFERSPPAWEDRRRAAAPKAALGGYIGLSGKLTSSSAPQLEALRRAASKSIAHARLDLASVTGFDDAGARLLAEALGEARRRQFRLQLQNAQRLKPALETLVGKGREGGEGAWLLSLELLQWENDRARFEDRAVDFAVTFELSPPSWEPPVALAGDADARADEPDALARAVGDVLAVSGVMTGAMSPQVAKIIEFGVSRAVVAVDMSDVERIDFVCAGALLNAINRIESQRRVVQILGASPIIRALLLLIGVSPRHFLKKAS